MSNDKRQKTPSSGNTAIAPCCHTLSAAKFPAISPFSTFTCQRTAPRSMGVNRNVVHRWNFVSRRRRRGLAERQKSLRNILALITFYCLNVDNGNRLAAPPPGRKLRSYASLGDWHWRRRGGGENWTFLHKVTPPQICGCGLVKLI